jgi:1,4-alpha-glucan branching enzyme
MEIIVLLIIVLDAVKVESKINSFIFNYKIFFLRYKIVLNSDAKVFDGHGRINDQQEFFTENIMWDDRQFSFKVYFNKYFS